MPMTRTKPMHTDTHTSEEGLCEGNNLTPHTHTHTHTTVSDTLNVSLAATGDEQLPTEHPALCACLFVFASVRASSYLLFNHPRPFFLHFLSPIILSEDFHHHNQTDSSSRQKKTTDFLLRSAYSVWFLSIPVSIQLLRDNTQFLPVLA